MKDLENRLTKVEDKLKKLQALLLYKAIRKMEKKNEHNR